MAQRVVLLLLVVFAAALPAVLGQPSDSFGGSFWPCEEANYRDWKDFSGVPNDNAFDAWQTNCRSFFGPGRLGGMASTSASVLAGMANTVIPAEIAAKRQVDDATGLSRMFKVDQTGKLTYLETKRNFATRQALRDTETDGTCTAIWGSGGTTCDEDTNWAETFSWAAGQRDLATISDQGRCGQDHVFAAAESLQWLAWDQSGRTNYVHVSKQQVADCATDSGNEVACQGEGWPINSFKYWTANQAVLESAYSTTADSAPGACQAANLDSASHVPVTVSGHVYINLGGNEVAMVGLAQERLYVVMVASQGPAFLFNDGFELHHDPNCASTPDHSVSLLGYGIDRTPNSADPYWLVKNSWGRRWGSHGMLMMVRYVNNQCGIATVAMAVV